jgi:hypothetical protein
MCKSQVSSIRSRDYLAKWAMEAKSHHGDLTRKIHAGVLEL